MLKIVRFGLLSIIFIAVYVTSSAYFFTANAQEQDGEEPIVPPVVEIEDDPAWEEFAFDLPFADDTGRLSFADLARSDEPFVLFWWLTNCPMCHLQMPFVEHMQNQIDEHGLEFSLVSICIDSNKNDCLEVIHDKKLTFPVLIDERGRRTKTHYDLDAGTPMTYIFGKGGVYLDSYNGFHSSLGKDVLRLIGIELPSGEADSK